MLIKSMKAALHTFQAARELERIDQMNQLARLKRYEADQLERRANRRVKHDRVDVRVKQAKTNGRSHDPNHVRKESRNDVRSEPYDRAECEAVSIGMWLDDASQRFGFTFNRKALMDGEDKFWRTIFIDQFGDAVIAMGVLAKKYSLEKRLPPKVRKEMDEYYRRLTTIRDCVKEELAEEPTRLFRPNGEVRVVD